MMKRDKYAIVLDFLPEGYVTDRRPSHRKTPIAQAIGTEKLTLLELTPKPGEYLKIGEKVYVGEGKRDKIQHVVGRITLDKLTNTARGELDVVIKQIVDSEEKRFVDFFNKAQPLSTRMHSLELLPGLGKKHMWEILEERKEGPFTSFDDIRRRVKLIPDPKKLVIRRIMSELTGKEKHKIFCD